MKSENLRADFYKSNSEHNFATGWPMWVQLWLRQLLAKAGVPEIIRWNVIKPWSPSHYSLITIAPHLQGTLASDPLDDIDSLWEESSENIHCSLHNSTQAVKIVAPGQAQSNSRPPARLHRWIQLLMHFKWNLVEISTKAMDPLPSQGHGSSYQFTFWVPPTLPNTGHMAKFDDLASPGHGRIINEKGWQRLSNSSYHTYQRLSFTWPCWDKSCSRKFLRASDEGTRK